MSRACRGPGARRGTQRRLRPGARAGGGAPAYAGSTNASTVANWLGRLFRLDFSVLAEVRANPSATSAAVVIVLVASLFAGLGSWLWALQSFVDDRDAFIRSFIVGSLLQTVVWFSWVYVAYLVLWQAYGARQDFGEMTRALRSHFAPVALRLVT